MHERERKPGIPPVVLIVVVVGLLVTDVGTLAAIEASSAGRAGRVDPGSPGDGSPKIGAGAAQDDAGVVAASSSAVLASGGDAGLGAVRDRLVQSAQHQDVGLEAMAPLYAPAVVRARFWDTPPHEAGRPATSSGADGSAGADGAGDGSDRSQVRTCGAFFVGPGRLAVPLSVVRGAVGGEVVLDAGRRFAIERIVAEAPEVDLALVTVNLPSELMRGLQAAFLEPLPGERVLLIGPAIRPGEEDPQHPLATARVQRVRIGESLVSIELDEPLPDWSLGSPVLNEVGKLAGYVGRDGQGALRVYGAERLLRIEPLPGLSLARWTAGERVESTRPPPESKDQWAAIRALPRPEGFGPAPERFKGFEVRPARIERTASGLSLDERFTVRGSGTQDDPYVVPWSLLMSASETFNPARGKLVLPERVTLLEGSWVRLEGNVAIPFAERFVEELLLMQHPWDGCCLGVPPTPYDAVEVSLAVPIEQRPSYASVAGRFRVDPFVRGQWLYGMYLLDEARIVGGGQGSEDN